MPPCQTAWRCAVDATPAIGNITVVPAIVDENGKLVATWTDGEKWEIPNHLYNEAAQSKKNAMGENTMWAQEADGDNLKMRLDLVKNGDQKFYTLFQWTKENKREQVVQLKPPIACTPIFSNPRSRRHHGLNQSFPIGRPTQKVGNRRQLQLLSTRIRRIIFQGQSRKWQ